MKSTTVATSRSALLPRRVAGVVVNGVKKDSRQHQCEAVEEKEVWHRDQDDVCGGLQCWCGNSFSKGERGT